MKNNRCPYCGKRVSYMSAYVSRRKAEYVCPRCGKESRVLIKNSVVPVFIVFALLAVGIMFGWTFAGLSENPLGILFVALPLIIFAVISPRFVEIEPLKKYKKSMEAKKAGIEYSDNLIMSEIEEEPISPDFSDTDRFQINDDVFNKIRDDRNAKREKLKNESYETTDKAYAEVESTTKKSDGRYVHIIDNVTEEHSYDSSPLKKIHSDVSQTVSRSRHYIPSSEPEQKNTEDKTDTNRYSGNRKF